MIVYLTTRKHAYTLAIQLHFFPGALAERVRLLPYEDLDALADLPAAAYVFTDFDRLSADALRRAGRLFDWLEANAPGATLLNRPGRTLMRFEFLRRLHDAGVNDFNVWRLDAWREVRVFPAFIRRGSDHRGPVTPLLRDSAELAAAVARLEGAENHADLMIVGFGNRAWADERFRKFGTFRVGGTIYAQHCYITRDWLGKGVPGDLTAAHIAEAEAYRQHNPHAGRIMEIFRIAGIDYGRMDYAVLDGRIQVFEINTNPTVIGHPWVADPAVRQEKFARMHETPMLLIDAPPGPSVAFPEALRERSVPLLPLDRIHARALSQTIRRVNLHYGWKAVRRPLNRFAGRLRRLGRAAEG